MNSQTKEAVVGELRERLDRSTIAILTAPRGLTVAQVTKFRRRVRELSGEYKIAKNTLARRAVDDTGFAPLRPLLKGPTALVFGYGDPVAVAKEVLDYASQNAEKLEVKGAVLDGQLFAPAEVEALSKLGTKEQVRAQLLGMLQAPASQLVRLLSEPGAGLARVIAARGENGAPAGE